MPSYPDDLIKSILRSVKTIAMVGASGNDIRPSYFAMMYLLNKGYKVIPVNPGMVGKEILGQEVYLQFEMVSLVGLQAGSVLAHQDKQRQENRLQRHDHRHQREGERVEGMFAVRVDIPDEPDCEPDYVEDDEPHSSGLSGDDVADAFGYGTPRQRLFLQFTYRSDVAGRSRGGLHPSMLSRDGIWSEELAASSSGRHAQS